MENVINNPGFQHLVEYIFLNLNIEDLKKCQLINQAAKNFLDNPILWKKLFQRGCPSINVETRRELSYVRKHLMKNQKDWITAIELEMNSDKGTNIVKYLKWILKKGDIFDLPCYTSSAVQKDFRRNIKTSVQQSWPWNRQTEIIKTLSSLIDNPNAHDQTGRTPIYWVAWKGNTEIVKILAPLTDNPNAPNTAGETPIHNAACNGHAEIIKILAPLTVNPNAPDNIGRTPIKIAKNEDIRRIIESFNVSTNRNVRKRARSKKEPKSDDIVVHFKNLFISKRARKS